MPILLLALVALFLPAVAHAQECGLRSPAMPPPQMLWPDGLRPANTGRPGRQLPDNRDSTDYITQTIPGAQSGHELFESIAALDGWLFVAYNAGLQVWRPQARTPDIPARVTYRDGWQGHWLEFPRPGEADSFITDLAVAPLAGGRIAVATAAQGQVGLAIWQFDPETRTLVQAYQYPNEIVNAVATARYGDRTYVFASIASAVQVFDATAAIAGEPCTEDIRAPECPGVHLGPLGGAGRSRVVAAHTFEGPERTHLMVASADARPDGTEVRLVEVNNPLRPGLADDGGSARVRYEGIADVANGMAFFEKGGHAWLAVLDHFGGPNRPGNQIVVDTIDACLGAPCDLGAPAWASPHFPSRAAHKTLRHSVDDRGTADPGDDEHFLYMGFLQGIVSGASAERLYHLRGLDPAGPNADITEITAAGATYADGCSGEDVGYWGWYHPRNDNGLRALTPRNGVFLGDRFYRTARSVFDVHVWTRPAAPPPPEVDMGPPADMGPPVDMGEVKDGGSVPDTGIADATLDADVIDAATDAARRADASIDPDYARGDAAVEDARDSGDAILDGSGDDSGDDSSDDGGCGAGPAPTAPDQGWLFAGLILLAVLRRRA